MSKDEQEAILRQLDAHSGQRPNPMGAEEFRVIESKRYIPYEGAEPRWLIIKDERCIF